MVAVIADKRRKPGGSVVETVDLDRDAKFFFSGGGFVLECKQAVASRDPKLDDRDLADAFLERAPCRVQHADEVRRAVR